MGIRDSLLTSALKTTVLQGIASTPSSFVAVTESRPACRQQHLCHVLLPIWEQKMQAPGSPRCLPMDVAHVLVTDDKVLQQGWVYASPACMPDRPNADGIV